MYALASQHNFSLHHDGRANAKDSKGSFIESEPGIELKIYAYCKNVKYPL